MADLTLTLETAKTVELYAGPGGWDEGARILGGHQLLDHLGILGFELVENAAETARRAGHHRLSGKEHGDVSKLDPTRALAATGLICSPPCPPFSASGLRKGTLDGDYQLLLDCMTHLGEDPDCDCMIDTLREQAADPRTYLTALGIAFAFRMPSIEWAVFEQVPALELCWEELTAEFYATGWEWCDFITFDAIDLGTGARRPRTYLVARRYAPPRTQLPLPGTHEVVPSRTMADLLGWPEGEMVRTRGNRRATGGNLFSADGPSWCLTGKTRSWERDSDGMRLTAAEMGYLQGFPHDYPWQGSNTAQHQQTADVVCPPAGAVILGVALDIDWNGPLAAWAAGRVTHLPPSAWATAEAAGHLFPVGV